jgi:hypothetical protein
MDRKNCCITLWATYIHLYTVLCTVVLVTYFKHDSCLRGKASSFTYLKEFVTFTFSLHSLNIMLCVFATVGKHGGPHRSRISCLSHSETGRIFCRRWQSTYVVSLQLEPITHICSPFVSFNVDSCLNFHSCQQFQLR